MAQSQDFIRNLLQASGACIDPVTGDFLFDTWGGSNEVTRVSGFATPTPSPSCTPGPWVFQADHPFDADSAALATDGAFAYAFGGSSSNGGGEHAEANRYDPAANSWTALASMTTGSAFYFHGNSNSHSNSNSHGNSHSHSHSHSHSYANCHTYRNGNRNPYDNANSDGNADRDAYGDGDSYSHCDTDTDTHDEWLRCRSGLLEEPRAVASESIAAWQPHI